MTLDKKEFSEIRLIITGSVQGVCFRMDTQQKALRLGLCGWVRNLERGDVEVLAQGPTDKLEALIQWCQKGPPLAHVKEVQVVKTKIKEQFDTFEIC